MALINSKASLKLDGRLAKQAKGAIERYNFDVGVIHDRQHMKAGKGQKNLAGGPSRKISRKASGLTIAEVSEEVRKQTGVNFYTRPFRSKKNRELVRFVRDFFQVVSGRKQAKQLENSLQAIVRNPIMRGDYGSNKSLTAKIKGFNRLLIDTGQLFKAIKARIARRV